MKLLYRMFKKQYHPLNTITLSKENLLHNYNYLVELTNKHFYSHSSSLTKRPHRNPILKGEEDQERVFTIAPVLKSNAYGHGIVQIAKILDEIKPPFLCVDSLHEAYQLLREKIKTPLLIMGYISPENLAVKKLPFMYAVYTYEMLEAVKKYQPQAGVHIFVDTGMHREGVLLRDLSAFIKKAKELDIHIVGLMSHFAMADKPQDKNTKRQLQSFQKAKEILSTVGITPKYIHLPASSGALHKKEYRKNLGSTARVGIALYGIDPEAKNNLLRPILALTSTIAQIKEIEKGESIGYDFTFTAKKNMKIGILPIGYNDGVNRKLSNKGFVKIRNAFCPIVARVSMNITIIDISKVPLVKAGDQVVVYSNNPRDKNNIFTVAKMCDVLPYEILVQLHASTKRAIV